ncbi:MAG: cytochrome B6 [Geobacteraceae bacterium GWC2_58_44]|nr:MAG: cytochrome B6 [Geobacteraceae bacterium GWC2_58_44]
MMRGYVRSSPYFFRPIKIAMALLVLALLVLAALIPAPLQEPADISRVPNPVRSAWFLLWIQELVSYSKYLIYAVLALTASCILLPWLSGSGSSAEATWLGRDRLPVSAASVLLFIAIGVLTVIAMFFRGENWAFVLPF